MSDQAFMQRALELAARGEGRVEPNPMVGCVVVRDGQIVGEGWHQRFGGPHAEFEALRAAGDRARDATLYVTLEPCCHHGKTPPCTEAIIRARLRRVIAALEDPFPRVTGRGMAALERAGIAVEQGVLAEEARNVCAPYLKLIETGYPWVLAKWAMTLDGKIATTSGDSRWISGPASRRRVHQLRGRVDAILVGRRTAQRDDPTLTARPGGPRTATRVVVDSAAQLALDSRLVRTVDQAPVLVAASSAANRRHCRQLEDAGVEVFICADQDPNQRLLALLAELGRRQMTNVLAEGGAALLGSLRDLGQIDEVHVLVAPKLTGGATAPGPLGGAGIDHLADAWQLDAMRIEPSGEDVYLSGRVRRKVES